MTLKVLRKRNVKKPITNYGKLLAEIQYFESIGNELMVDKLTELLDKAREKDREKSKSEKCPPDQEL